MIAVISLELGDNVGKNHKVFENDGIYWNHKYAGPDVPEVEAALRALKALFHDHEKRADVPIISLTGRTRLNFVRNESDIIDYEIDSYSHNQTGRPHSIYIYTGPYVGF